MNRDQLLIYNYYELWKFGWGTFGKGVRLQGGAVPLCEWIDWNQNNGKNYWPFIQPAKRRQSRHVLVGSFVTDLQGRLIRSLPEQYNSSLYSGRNSAGE